MEQVSRRQIWTRYGWLALAGAALWAVVMAAAYVYAGQTGKPVGPTAVTWVEWAVAIGWLPMVFQLVMGILGMSDVEHKTGRRVIGTFTSLSFVCLVAFLLDLVTRAVLGLGFEPF
jgi:hypothetical protein